MSEEQYTQIRRPVNRLAEKMLGWLGWIILLILTMIAMFLGLVYLSNDVAIQNLELSLNNSAFVQEVLASNGANVTQLVIWLQNFIWAIIVYLIVCLLISFLALISMNIRILSGCLFLFASVITIPLAFVIVPILFFIAAIMMFARKYKIEWAPAPPYYQSEYYEPSQPAYTSRESYGYAPTQDYPKEPVYEDTKTAEVDTSRVHEQMRQESEATDQVTEPGVMSRQARNQRMAETEQEMDGSNTQHYDVPPEAYEPPMDDMLTREEEKAQKRELRAQRRAEKKERKARIKEQRKNEVSAVNQRRMNFEERKQINKQKFGEPNKQQETSKTDASDTSDKS